MRRAALLAVAAVVFAVPAAAVTMLALYALRRSQWLTSTAWISCCDSA